uniref:Uncharacterized protein n=2 Tax=Anguilla anguilla TaxID=7936 RepID=A0A0E9VXJ2_ANGAN
MCSETLLLTFFTSNAHLQNHKIFVSMHVFSVNTLNLCTTCAEWLDATLT